MRSNRGRAISFQVSHQPLGYGARAQILARIKLRGNTARSRSGVGLRLPSRTGSDKAIYCPDTVAIHGRYCYLSPWRSIMILSTVLIGNCQGFFCAKAGGKIELGDNSLHHSVTKVMICRGLGPWSSNPRRFIVEKQPLEVRLGMTSRRLGDYTRCSCPLTDRKLRHTSFQPPLEMHFCNNVSLSFLRVFDRKVKTSVRNIPPRSIPFYVRNEKN
ncbi:uncharacterized protein EV420DRAFT_211698 [Desarmillaria tabescens]|uniref:Uncharacterized protein n=1 Tax=Armillaria tabescens TaxID=1929756 RepID=A0AA39N7I5_ARMTA|nr:uncharacterized protein EV420DRAFT_211698 [Desarmillaria tabescens]KAK0460458.1 hypothetical protein EV420DRAFT_211698 [Desarmillaria tabescens]